MINASMKKKQKNIVKNSVALAYIAFSVVFIIFLFKTQDNLQKEFNGELNTLKYEKDSIKDRGEFLIQFLKADNHYILGDYEEAMEKFDEIKNHPYKTSFEQDLIMLRLDRINEILTNIDTLSADIEAYRFSLNNAKENIEILEEEKDSIIESKRDEVANYEEQIAQLQDQIKEKDHQLSKKDKVQVISFRNEKGNQIHYLGEVKNEKANGGGVGIWDTGGLYKGSWKDNQRHGEGVYTWKDGHKYEGAFVEGIREGQGTYYWSSGEKYVGEWKNNMRNGQGTLYDRDNNIQFEGEWVDDKIKK